MANAPKVGGCFGVADQKFARHQNDLKRALKWLQHKVKQQDTWQSAKNELVNHMKSKGCSQAHIKNEIAYAEKMIRPWL